MTADEQVVHDKAMDLIGKQDRELSAWKALGQKITGVDANDHGWLRAQVDHCFAEAVQERDRIRAAAVAVFDSSESGTKPPIMAALRALAKELGLEETK